MSLWDPQQREWLQAMGHSLWVLAGDASMESGATEPAPDAPGALPPVGRAAVGQPAGKARPDRVPAQAPSRPAARRPPPVPGSPGPPADGAPARPRSDPAAKAAALEAARMGAAREADGPLREALLRATGQPPAVAARMLRRLDVDQVSLRDDPAAKRALWHRLRPLRKAPAQ